MDHAPVDDGDGQVAFFRALAPIYAPAVQLGAVIILTSTMVYLKMAEFKLQAQLNTLSGLTSGSGWWLPAVEPIQMAPDEPVKEIAEDIPLPTKTTPLPSAVLPEDPLPSPSSAWSAIPSPSIAAFPKVEAMNEEAAAALLFPAMGMFFMMIFSFLGFTAHTINKSTSAELRSVLDHTDFSLFSLPVVKEALCTVCKSGCISCIPRVRQTLSVQIMSVYDNEPLEAVYVVQAEAQTIQIIPVYDDEPLEAANAIQATPLPSVETKKYKAAEPQTIHIMPVYDESLEPASVTQASPLSSIETKTPVYKDADFQTQPSHEFPAATNMREEAQYTEPSRQSSAATNMREEAPHTKPSREFTTATKIHEEAPRPAPSRELSEAILITAPRIDSSRWAPTTVDAEGFVTVQRKKKWWETPEGKPRGCRGRASTERSKAKARERQAAARKAAGIAHY